MYHRSIASLLACFILALLVGGCASTKVKHVWTDPQIAPEPARKVMVLAVHDNPPVREMLEGQFMRQLQRRGVEVRAGSRHFTVDDLQHNEEAVAAKLREWEVDAAIVLRLVDSALALEQRATGPRYTTLDGFYLNWRDYYSTSYRPTGRNFVPHSGVSKYVAVETNFYDLVPTEKLVWSGLTQTKLTEDADNLLRAEEYIALVVGQLVQAGWLP